ncbi:MAG TPA: sigma-70 family RNA polymerase sigma factor [Solirubrobacteraceae bacterium]|nr:sigma-70 family RNA polymerase sigma factor [Solirubrobacteraceae bacterium]
MERFEDKGLPLRRLPDEVLISLMVGGDAQAFAVLYGRHRQVALGLAVQMCARPAIAEEVVQEAFLSFWRSRASFDRKRGSVRTWVLGIVRNRAIDVLRHSVGQEMATTSDRGISELLEADELTERDAAHRERSRALHAALDGLPPEQSRVIALAFYGGYSHTEIATMLDTPVGTVKGRMRLGLRKMAVSVAPIV